MAVIDKPTDPRPGWYDSPGDVAAAYRAGQISYLSAVGWLMTLFGWSQTDAEELLNEVGPGKPGVDPDPPPATNGDEEGNGDDTGTPMTLPGDYTLVGLVVGLWLLSKIVTRWPKVV